MIKNLLVTTSLAAGLLLVSLAQAQRLPYPMPPADQALEQRPMPGMMMPPIPHPDDMAMPPMADFPTPQELERMVPPEPITEQTIRERFAKHKERVTNMLERDRQAAEKYAQDFAKYQKYQAEALVKMMARAEKRREQVVKRLEEQEQRILESFQQEKAAAATPAETAPQRAQ